MHRLLLWGIVGLVAQLIDGSMGMAYGVTSTTLLLTTGLAPAIASASVHLAEVGTSLASGVFHWRFGNVDWSLVRRIGIPGAMGAFAGATVLSMVSTRAARPWMAAVLLVLGGYLLVRFAFGGEIRPKGRPYVRKRHLAMLGAAAGFLDATGGGGWGPAATPTLIATGKIETRTVVGSVSASEFLVAAAASLGFVVGLGWSGIEWPVVLALLGGGIIAAPLGALVVRLVKPRVLGAGVGGLVVLTNAQVLLSVLGAGGTTRALVSAALLAAWAAAIARAMRRSAVPADREASLART